MPKLRNGNAVVSTTDERAARHLGRIHLPEVRNRNGRDGASNPLRSVLKAMGAETLESASSSSGRIIHLKFSASPISGLAAQA